jgi:hypothetical protein
VGLERRGMAVAPGTAPLLSGDGVPAGQAADAEQRFGALLESVPDAMVIVDGAGTIKLVNAQTEALFGYPRAELLGCLSVCGATGHPPGACAGRGGRRHKRLNGALSPVRNRAAGPDDATPIAGCTP